MKISVNSVIKEYNGFFALNDFTFEIEKPGIYPIIGISGSGKTTLLKITSGLLSPTSGSVFYDDVDIFKLSFDQRASFRNHKIGFIFQDHYLEKNFSCIENVILPLYISKKYQKSEIYEKAKEALKLVGLDEKLNQIAHTLSGGEAQRVAIARAIVNEPEVIFADEPTGNLDEANSLKVMEILEKISQSKIVILVTHNHIIAKKYHGVIHIKDGRRFYND